MNEFEAKCTQEQFESLHKDLAKVRRTSKTVRVDKAALTALLMDHSELWAQLQK